MSKNFDESVRRNGGEEIPLSQMVHELMEDTAKADWSMLPQTGCDPEWEYDLSSIFIDTDTKVVSRFSFSISFLSFFLSVFF